MRKKEQMTWGVSTEQLATVCAKQNFAQWSVRAYCCKTLLAKEVADPCARRASLRTETTNLSSRVHIIPSRTHRSAIFLRYGQNCPLKSVKCASWLPMQCSQKNPCSVNHDDRDGRHFNFISSNIQVYSYLTYMNRQPEQCQAKLFLHEGLPASEIIMSGIWG